MTELNWVYTACGAIALTLLFIAGVMFLSWGFTEAKIEETEGMMFLNRRSAAHIMERCLQNKGEYITTDFLGSFTEKKICSLCGVCAIEVGLKIRDLEEEGREWNFGYKEAVEAKRKSELFTNIKSGGEVHVGKIYTHI